MSFHYHNEAAANSLCIANVAWLGGIANEVALAAESHALASCAALLNGTAFTCILASLIHASRRGFVQQFADYVARVCLILENRGGTHSAIHPAVTRSSERTLYAAAVFTDFFKSAIPMRASTKSALDLPQQHVRERDIPSKILIADDDELELSLMSDRLRANGFDVTTAANGEEALKLLEREWFPLVMTDWQMPVMDGIQLVEKLRERGGDDSYFIILSIRTSSEDVERGYCAGVDDYLSKKATDAEIMARIEAGLNTVALRRSLRQSRAALAITQSRNDAAFVDAKSQLIAKLQSEIARAKRYRRPCSVLLLGVHPVSPEANSNAKLGDAVRVAAMHALQGALRIDIDSVALYDTGENHMQFAVVLPETGPAEVAVVRSRVRAALQHCLREHLRSQEAAAAFDVSIGAASVDVALERSALTPEALLAVAENCRRCMASCGERRLTAVQSSVISQAAIPCRHGYAVADHCLELEYRYADNQSSSSAGNAST